MVGQPPRSIRVPGSRPTRRRRLRVWLEKPRLLLVEDDRPTVAALQKVFSRKGWWLSAASTVAEALPLLKERPDWVILDLMLPDEEGTALLRVIRAGNLPIRVVVDDGVPRILAPGNGDLASAGSFSMKKPIRFWDRCCGAP